MTRRVRVRPEAELDLLVAAGWYEAQRQGLGTEFIDARLPREPPIKVISV